MCLGNLQCLDYRQHSSREAGPNPERGWSKVFLRPAAFGWDFVGGGGTEWGEDGQLHHQGLMGSPL